MAELLLSRRTAILGAGLALSGLALRDAEAAALQFNPVSIAMEPSQSAAELEVTNTGTEQARLQVRGFRWSQQDNEDKLDPTPDLIVSPPQFVVAAGQTQTVRILSRDANQQNERTFRVLLDEIPSPHANSVAFAMRVSLPIVQAGAAKGAPVLNWRMERQTDGQAVLIVRNNGDRMVRFVKLEPVLGKRTLTVQMQSPSPYALPGGERRWMIRDGAQALAGGADPVRLSVETQQMPRIETSVAIPR
jgi:fimbrial chaperone protein